MNKGFAIIEMMLIVWVATLIGYGIHRGVIEIKDAPPPRERSVANCDGFPINDPLDDRR